MKPHSKLGITATSLAAAATLLPAGPAKAVDEADAIDLCKICPGDLQFVFIKMEDVFVKLETLEKPAVDAAALRDHIFLKLEDAFIKIEF